MRQGKLNLSFPACTVRVYR